MEPTRAIRDRLLAAEPHLGGCEINAARRPGSSADWVPVRDLVRSAPEDLRRLLDENDALRAALTDLLLAQLAECREVGVDLDEVLVQTQAAVRVAARLLNVCIPAVPQCRRPCASWGRPQDSCA